MDEELKLIDTQTRAEKVKTFLLDNKKTGFQWYIIIPNVLDNIILCMDT